MSEQQRKTHYPIGIRALLTQWLDDEPDMWPIARVYLEDAHRRMGILSMVYDEPQQVQALLQAAALLVKWADELVQEENLPQQLDFNELIIMLDEKCKEIES